MIRLRLSYHNTLWLSITILALALWAGMIVYPRLFNKVSDFLSKQIAVDIGKIEMPFQLGLDLQGGTHLIYEADVSGIKGISAKEALDSVRNVIERRVNLFGVAEPLVQIAKAGQSWRLIVELAGVKDVKEAIRLIGETPYLDFREESPQGKSDDLSTYVPTQLNGSYLKRALVEFSSVSGEPQVSLEFSSQGATIFEELTKKNLNKRLAIFLDGLPISAPVVQSIISGGKAVISGEFILEEAKTLAKRMNAGALPVPIKLISQETIGASLGQDSLAKVIKASLWGVFALSLFILFYYRFPGFLGIIALAIYIVFLLGLYKVIPVTLTLAGIAGFILSLGIAIDANILIFERIKDERKEGKSLQSAIDQGFLRAWSSVRDGNVTTIISAFILYFIGSSFVQGFAFTLILGILLSMFSAVFVSRLLLEVFAQTRLSRVEWIWKAGFSK